MKKYLGLILCISLCLSGCSGGREAVAPKNGSPSPVTEKPETTVEKPKLTIQTYPKVDGSTATIPLSEAIVSSILGLSKEEAAKFINHNTTHKAYENLIKGKADIIFVTEPSEDELKLAKVAGVELEIVPVVKEGFVFLVNTKNPVNNLTLKQIQDIYQGKTRNWKEVGGADREIVAFQREKNSGSQTLMEQTVMKGLKMVDSPKNIIQGMGELIKSVAGYDNSERALGYSVFYYAKTMFTADTIKLIGVDGTAPDNKSISSGKYPIVTAYYAVIKKTDPANSNARKLLEWVLSVEGQKLAENVGYVPLEVR